MTKHNSYPVTVRIPDKLYHWLRSHLESQREAWKQEHPGEHPKTHQFTISDLAKTVLEAHHSKIIAAQENSKESPHGA